MRWPRTGSRTERPGPSRRSPDHGAHRAAHTAQARPRARIRGGPRRDPRGARRGPQAGRGDLLAHLAQRARPVPRRRVRGLPRDARAPPRPSGQRAVAGADGRAARGPRRLRRRRPRARARVGAAVSERPLLLHVQGVSKSFPGVQALDDMHLDVRGGEVLALVGENGAGKSTLMKLLSGIHGADEGEFFLNGEPYEPASPKHPLELGISVIHQEFNLMPDLTVAQNLFIGREPGGFFTSERRLNARAQELIERLHLPLRPKDEVGNLTVAKQQMVEIGKA